MNTRNYFADQFLNYGIWPDPQTVTHGNNTFVLADGNYEVWVTVDNNDLHRREAKICFGSERTKIIYCFIVKCLHTGIKFKVTGATIVDMVSFAPVNANVVPSKKRITVNNKPYKGFKMHIKKPNGGSQVVFKPYRLLLTCESLDVPIMTAPVVFRTRAHREGRGAVHAKRSPFFTKLE